jgi:methylmalonyl-CoA mutase cobalamin-binding subunit
MATSLTSFEDEPRTGPQKDAAPWAELLNKAIESEILPRLLAANRATSPDHNIDVTGFVALIIADDMEQIRATADRVIVLTGSRDALLEELLAPAARLLGEMWEQDVCDFVTVTLGVYRLDQVMKETATAGQGIFPLNTYENRILLVPAPGEQHSFGLGMVADAFREGGWCVRSGPAVTKPQLLRLVHDEWFDVVGLSVSSDRWLKGLPTCIRAARQSSCNADAFFIVGGAAITNHQERTRFLGADATALDARDALQQANIFMETAVTAGLHRAKKQLFDAG